MSTFGDTAAHVAQSACVPWGAFEGKHVVISGATGLIGRTIVAALLARNGLTGDADKTTRITALVRDEQKARRLFGEGGALSLLVWDAESGVVPNIAGVDYIIHCAAPTGSSFFMERPIETVDTVVNGTSALLKLADRTGARLCLLSTMEVYGAGADEPLTEDRGGAMDAMNVRSSYPEAKQLAEALCAAYSGERGVETCVARLAQTFGPGVAYADGRVFAEFARCCLEHRDIVLLTNGTKRNMYLSTADASTAALLLVAHGAPGEAYNVANEATLTSIVDMAHAVADRFGEGETHVRIEEDADAAKRFRPGKALLLDTTKLRALGWQPELGLPEMYEALISDWSEQRS